MALDPVAESPETTTSPEPEEPSIRPGHGEMILVAEDNPVNQQVTVFMLESLGYLADVVANGQEALEALDRGHYDLVLMDCQMPVMDGYEATTRIRQRSNFSDLPILAMTANALADDRDRCLAIGMSGYLAKPVQIEELAGAIEQCLEAREISAHAL